MPDKSDSYEYILYIDEAGDDGLKRVQPIDPTGASEWLCIGAVLIRVNNETNVVSWVKDIRQDINAKQGPALHYKNLSPTKKRRACQMLAEKQCVCFIVCSNKKNMRGWNNERAANRGGKQWFYNFCVRLLMERATEICFNDSKRNHSKPRLLKVIFSQRGGHSYSQTMAYWELLKTQSSAGSTFLSKRTIRHEVLKFGMVEYVPHTHNAGLQLADLVASAFFQAANSSSSKWDIEPAKMLKPKMAKVGGIVADFGVVLQPTPPEKAKLSFNQRKIFEEFGYSFSDSVGLGP